MKKIILFLILLPTIITYAEIGEYADASVYVETNFNSNELNINLNFDDQKYFWIQSNFSLKNDEKYRYEPWQDVTMFGIITYSKKGM